MALIIPKNNAEEKTLDATLKIYFDANDWVANEVLIDKLSSALDNLGIEEEKKEPQSYTKKTQVLAYYGFIIWEDETNAKSRRKITDLGKRFYKAKLSKDSSGIIEILIESLNTCTFGRNVTGCNSDSDLEPPNIFLKSALLLDGLNLNEFAYILQKMEFDNAELADAIFDVSLNRKMGQQVSPNAQAAKWKDPKPILALGNWGLFSVEKKDGLNRYYLNKYVIENYSRELMALRTKNTETLRFVMNNIDDGFMEYTDKNHQVIYYGAPGTGKSNTIKQEVDDKGLPCERTTFHPDSDYSTFVGAYKPTTVKEPVMTVIGTKATPVENPDGTPRIENKIVYEFVPQAFLKAYTGAWKNQSKPFYLIIEEINRGNCAQIFGDLFQLLDRNDKTGRSDYPISPDEDVQKFLLTDKKYGFAVLTDEQIEAIPEDVRKGELMILPENLHIWATMNTSDQSLFPIDSAFKRRWDWQYMPITDGKKGWKIEANGKRYDWWQFLQKINDRIGTTTNSEDKKLGYYFCKAKASIIDAETFVGKVLFYIWNDVYKDFAEEAGDLFLDVDGTVLSFSKFYTVGEDGKAKVVEDKVERFLSNLGVVAENETIDVERTDNNGMTDND